MAVIDQNGNTVKASAIGAPPQTSLIPTLAKEQQNHYANNLTPSKLASYLESAESGDITAQYELFEDMEERDGHIASEMGKRRRALLVDWSIQPPPNADAREKKVAEQVADLVAGIDNFEDVLLDVTDAIGKGFCCLEIEWHRVEKFWLPKSITHRPHSWFRIYRGYREEIRLKSETDKDGVPLQPFGWIAHTHKAKSGYLARSPLFRQLVWTFLFKSYSVGDLAEFLEIYGIPMRLGTYPTDAKEKEKAVLLQALSQIGHKGSGIVPEGMKIDFKDATSGTPDPFALMIDWCDKNQSKVILGGTLTSGADGKTSTNALGKIHDEVRKDLRDSDIRQVCATLKNDLIYTIAASNGLAPGGIGRAPRFVLTTGETEDVTAFADALPKLASIGMQIPVAWAHDTLGIPMPQNNEPVLAVQSPFAPDQTTSATPSSAPKSALAALSSAELGATARLSAQKTASLAAKVYDAGQPEIDKWLDQIAGMIQQHPDASPEELQKLLAAEYEHLPMETLTELLTQAFILSHLQGMDAVRESAK